MADQKWEDVTQILQQAADDCFPQRPRSEQIDGYKELVVAREAALRQRRRARARLVELGEQEGGETKDGKTAEEEQEKIAWRKAQGLRRKWEKLKRATLEEEAERAGRTAIAYKISRLPSGRSSWLLWTDLKPAIAESTSAGANRMTVQLQ